jgi:hypothetical protein
MPYAGGCSVTLQAKWIGRGETLGFKRHPNSPLPILRDLHPSPYVALAISRLAAPIAFLNVDSGEGKTVLLMGDKGFNSQ